MKNNKKNTELEQDVYRDIGENFLKKLKDKLGLNDIEYLAFIKILNSNLDSIYIDKDDIPTSVYNNIIYLLESHRIIKTNNIGIKYIDMDALISFYCL